MISSSQTWIIESTVFLKADNRIHFLKKKKEGFLLHITENNEIQLHVVEICSLVRETLLRRFWLQYK